MGGTIWVEIILYPGRSVRLSEYFTGLFDSNGQQYKIETCYLGYKLTLSDCNISLDILADNICHFIFDNHLKEAVISKVYDEYPCFNTAEAVKILSEVSQEFLTTPIKDSIIIFLKEKQSFNIESYCIFNLKLIMLCVYAITDKICQNMIFIKEKEKFLSMIHMFSKLSFDKCNRADVEFSDDNKCSISFDKSSPLSIHNDELLPLLVHKSPNSVNIENSHIYPELSDIIAEIFNSEKNK